MMPSPAAFNDPRVAEARARCGPRLRDSFTAAGLAYPPGELHLRGYKLERRLEIWAGGVPCSRLVPVATLPILAASGEPGPKRCEGDLQVPEGFYRINRFNPRSRFYLSLGLDYPNASDRCLAPDSTRPGSDIFLHGGEQSHGCLALGDEAMMFLYLAALDIVGSNGSDVSVHLFPCQMDLPTWNAKLTPCFHADPDLRRFWETLAEADRIFRKTERPAAPETGNDGRYFFR